MALNVYITKQSNYVPPSLQGRCRELFYCTGSDTGLGGCGGAAEGIVRDERFLLHTKIQCQVL